MVRPDRILFLNRIVPDAYHGTKLDTARLIIKERKFLIGREPDQYLGDGIYFFEASIAYAREFASNKFQKAKIGIIRASISLGRCLDLNDLAYCEMLWQVAEKLEERGVTDLTDAFLINYYAENIEPFDTVRVSRPRSKGQKKLFRGSHFYRYVHLMICVRKPKQILQYELV